ncbi:MAG: Fe-S cluster assembly protein SufD [Brumimicrobium sp.]|nr:Fe-S cluster assembly protein SufD [Brumimicrobium sp.]
MEMVIDNKVLEFVADLKLPEVISNVRKQAADALNGMDFPTTKVEEWKYTRVSKYVKKKYIQSKIDADIQKYIPSDLEGHRLIFINGYYNESLSSIIKEDNALNIQSIELLNEEYYTDILEDISENVFSLINKAYQTGGIFIQVKENAKLKYPIHLLFLTKGNGVIANTRNFIQLESGAEAEVFVTFNSENSDDSFTNCVLEGHVENNAHLTITKLQSEENNVFHVSKDLFIQDTGSTFKMNTITTGGSLIRNSVDVLVEGENCHTELNGVYLGVEKQLIDNHTLIDQMFPNCTSNELYKGVMGDESTGVFNGRVIVRQDAQKIQAYQSNKNILLTKKASVNSKPELEIYADDVMCSHGSTVGDLDDDAIFYLKTRGISEEKAKHMLIGAFIGDVLERIENEPIREIVNKRFTEKFGWEF